MNNYIKIGVGILLVNDNKILLGRRVNDAVDTGGIYEPGSWTLPGGKQEYDETIVDCAKRETKEETNLDIDDVVVIGADDDIQPDRHFITIHTCAHFYSGELKIMEPEKIDTWQWFPFDELPENIYSPSRKTIQRYLERMKNYE